MTLKWTLFIESEQRDLEDEGQLRHQLVEWQSRAINHPIIALLSAPDGTSMTIGLGHQRSALASYDLGGWPSRHVVDDTAEDGLVHYMFTEQFTEIPLRYTIRIEEAIQACVTFMATGKIDDSLQWEED